MRFRSQSAMEYLMTYGWAVLIIAVVLAALYSLGVFNSATWGPRASPGSCKVFRSTAVTTLEGVCNNVIPRSVAQFSGASSVVKVPYSSSLSLTSQATMSGWYYVNSVSPTLIGTVVAQQGASTFSSFGSRAACQR